MENILILHKKCEFDLEEYDKDELINILCRVLLDRRESVVDSAMRVAGQIINLTGKIILHLKFLQFQFMIHI